MTTASSMKYTRATPDWLVTRNTRLIGRADFAATENGVVFGLFPDRLKLRSETIVGDKLLEETQKEIASRNGDFVPTRQFAIFDLEAAVLLGGDLRGVDLSDKDLRGANLSFARLDGASLADTHLSGTRVTGLQGADLSFAWLQGARLSDAKLQGANLAVARLQGADLEGAHLQGANLGAARLQGADLNGAQLQGANLGDARLQGADLGDAQLQGADLRVAQAQGADLRSAQLQGTELTFADLSDSELDGTFVFRTDISHAYLATAAIRSAEAGAVNRDDSGKTAPLDDADVEKWMKAATEFGPERNKAEITRRFARLKPVQPAEQDASDQAKWAELAKQSLSLDPDGGQYRRRLADRLGELACAPDGAPYVARGLISGDPPRLATLGDQLSLVRARMEEGRKTGEANSLLERLAETLATTKPCPGVAGFTDADWRALETIKPVQPPNASGAAAPSP